MPMHWNYMGVVDSYGPKLQVLALFPIISAVILVLFQFLPKLDPNKENYPKFEKAWGVFQFAIIAFFGYIYFLTILVVQNPAVNMATWMMVGLGILFMVLGNYMGKIRKNYFVGIRFPWTIASEEVWNKTHRFGGKMFMLAGLLFLVNAYYGFDGGILLTLIITLALVAPVVYSYLLFRSTRK